MLGRTKELFVRDDRDDAAKMFGIIKGPSNDGALGRHRKPEKRLDHHDRAMRYL